MSIKNTEVVHQPAPGKVFTEPNITIYGQRLKEVNKFAYLVSTLWRNVIIDDEGDARLSKANSAFGTLNTNVWKYHTGDKNQGILDGCDDHIATRFRSIDCLPPPC